MTPYPFIFTPLFRPKVWGGRILEAWGKDLPADIAIGESWELADLPESIDDGRSVVANGPLAGKTLREILLADTESAIMGGAALGPDGGFPLLIKFLDARENLSVQVHPDDAYLMNHPDEDVHLKSEAWIVLDAAPGSVIYKGIDPGVDRETFRTHLEGTADSAVDDLIAIPVEAGDCHYLPSGTCHALGAGILVAEVQTPSDTTFRVYDWGRDRGELHVDQAMECIQFGAAPPERPAGSPIESGGIRIEPLVRTEYFSVERIDYSPETRESVVPTEGPLIWIVIDGCIELDCPAIDPIVLSKGDTTLIPARARDVQAKIAGGTRILRIQLPSPLEGMLA